MKKFRNKTVCVCVFIFFVSTFRKDKPYGRLLTKQQKKIRTQNRHHQFKVVVCLKLKKKIIKILVVYFRTFKNPPSYLTSHTTRLAKPTNHPFLERTHFTTSWCNSLALHHEIQHSVCSPVYLCVFHSL